MVVCLERESVPDANSDARLVAHAMPPCHELVPMVRICSTCGTANRIPASRLHLRARCGRCSGPMLPLHGMHEVSSAEEFEEIAGSSSLPVLFDFWAPWCQPCRAVAPELDKIARASSGRLLVAKVDTEMLPLVAARNAVHNLPTMVLYRSGKEHARISGALPARVIVRGLGLAA